MTDEFRVETVIEIPRGSRNKYEMDHETRKIWLDRYLYTATTYPADYGFFENTLGGDGDPLDALVLMNESTFPGCHLWARPVGVVHMADEAGDDAKVLCVLAGDPRWDHIQDIDDVNPALLDEIGHFFEVYKALEPNKASEIGRWGDAEAARTEIIEAQQRYADQQH
ncbi:MAG: inorganic diphosphatase [Microthrixaceae bacterium]|nr:inorganic diphosphatase [Microthrixaceae bacterium]